MPEHFESEPVNHFFQDCLDQARASRQWFNKVVLSLSLNQLRWRPRCDAWSIAECLDHLNRTLLHYLPMVEEAIARSPRQPAAPPRAVFLPQSEQEYLKEFEPPVRNAIVTPPALSPIPPRHPDQLVDEFPQLRERYSKVVRAASGLDLAEISIAGSVHPPVATAGGIIALLAVHDRRHLWQAGQIRRARAFPPALKN